MTGRDTVILLGISGAFAMARIAGVHGEVFQAFAHLWVGGLIGAWLGMLHAYDDPATADSFCVAWIMLSLVELACFVLGVGKNP